MDKTKIPFKEYDQIFEYVVDAKPLDIVDGRLIIRIKKGVAILSQVIDNKKKSNRVDRKPQ